MFIRLATGHALSIEYSSQHLIYQQLSSIVEGYEGSYVPNCQSNLVIAIHALPQLFYNFIHTTAYHLGRYEPSPPIICCTLRF